MHSHTLSQGEWRRLAENHSERVGAELADVVQRRDRGVKHPIDDFLFHYYNLRPSHLAQWHPGLGVAVEDDGTFASSDYYRHEGGWSRFDPEPFLAKRAKTVSTAHTILAASAQATPRFGCFGMHEWAMVYGLTEDQTRHPYVPLRFSPEEIQRIVEDVGCRCSHFDAFRFFTPEAKPLNSMTPTRLTQPELDQPGCLHVNMDLYKWAGKLHPAVGSELLFETFILARDIRVVDMAASAYDVSAWGIAPVKVETPEGRAEYVSLQREFASRAEPLRAAVLEVAEALLAAAN